MSGMHNFPNDISFFFPLSTYVLIIQNNNKVVTPQDIVVILLLVIEIIPSTNILKSL